MPGRILDHLAGGGIAQLVGLAEHEIGEPVALVQPGREPAARPFHRRGRTGIAVAAGMYRDPFARDAVAGKKVANQFQILLFDLLADKIVGRQQPDSGAGFDL